MAAGAEELGRLGGEIDDRRRLRAGAPTLRNVGVEAGKGLHDVGHPRQGDRGGDIDARRYERIPGFLYERSQVHERGNPYCDLPPGC